MPGGGAVEWMGNQQMFVQVFESRIIRSFRVWVRAVLLPAAAAAALGSAAFSCDAVCAERVEWRFDFGKVDPPGDSAKEYIKVDASVSYSEETGYGFADPTGVKNVSAGGEGVLEDAVRFKNSDPDNTFNVDLPSGLYEITVVMGDIARCSVLAEGYPQLIDLTGNNAVDSVRVPVTDGQLNIMASHGKENTAFSFSTLEIRRVSENPDMGPILWILGDSTACNYYPPYKGGKFGWGMMIGNYLSFLPGNAYDIRNLAAGGMYAQKCLDMGLFDTPEHYGKEGDLCLICFGINDKKHGSHAEYEQAVTQIVRRLKDKGVTPVLIKPQADLTQLLRTPVPERGWGNLGLERIGQEENVGVIDLYELSLRDWIPLGEAGMKALFVDGDDVHLNQAGADRAAKLIAGALEEMKEDLWSS